MITSGEFHASFLDSEQFWMQADNILKIGNKKCIIQLDINILRPRHSAPPVLPRPSSTSLPPSPRTSHSRAAPLRAGREDPPAFPHRHGRTGQRPSSSLPGNRNPPTRLCPTRPATGGGKRVTHLGVQHASGGGDVRPPTPIPGQIFHQRRQHIDPGQRLPPACPVCSRIGMDG